MQKLLGCPKSTEWITMNLFKKIKCDLCNEKFSKQEELMHHKEIIHFKDEPYDCQVCNENFSNMSDMRDHLKKNHSYKNER
jgi:KRAB domain-containing zinc finger protein